MVGTAIRVVGALFVFFGVLRRHLCMCPMGISGQLFRVYGGGSLPEGASSPSTVRTVRRAAFSRRASTWLLVNVLYDVDTTN